jgi:hypothetical protein
VGLPRGPLPLDPGRRAAPSMGYERAGPVALVVCAALAWYNTGTSWVTRQVLYRLRPLVGSIDAAAYQAQYTEVIQLPIVTGFGLLLLATAVLLWVRPPEVAEWAVWTGGVLEGLAVWASLTRDIPLQVRMATEGFSPALNAELTGGSWLRAAAITAHAVLLGWMVRRAMEPRGLLRGPSRWGL